jgi:hypothetical protein
MRLRTKYDMAEGTRIQIIDDGEQIILKPITPQYVHKLRGLLKGKGGLKVLQAERQREKDL